MDEKNDMEKNLNHKSPLPIYRTKHDPSLSNTLVRRSRRPLALYATASFFILLIITYGSPLLFPSLYPRPYPGKSSLQSSPSSTNQSSLVPLEAHIMSKCPDAKTCLEELVVPAMQQIVDKVDFRLSYIGKVDENDTIHCMHGSTECLGNMLGLCANDLFPNNPKISLGFSTCLIMSYQRIPSRDLVESCALEHGISFDDLNACISEEGKGLDLLGASVKRSEKAGVKKSCTVRVGGEKWCVMDGGKWKDCEGGHKVKDLVEKVERLYKSS
ncbi:hypothetical protein ABVK25_009571 [Lepraria finkii]|uniref:Gamma interferon inducible lysosomal thiol reductase GILT n=1 Tax=Lepraria finkii TaxID=1340010 RepID=A0ABR4AX30_9LECA